MSKYPFQNPKLPAAERTKDLMKRMTLEQKTQQLTCAMVMGMPQEEAIKNGVGEVYMFVGLPPAAELATMIRRTQDQVMEQSGWGIPAIVHQEALSGPMFSECAVFPTSIGLGATFAPELVKDMGDRIRKQMVNIGVRQALSPVLDLVRDFRWGRTGEDYGSDPTLVAAMSCAYISGLQGEDLREGVAATAKHFIGYSQTEGGLNGTRTVTDWRDIRENFAKPFEAAIRKADLKSVMNSYSEYDGELICGSKRILTDLLRDDLGFDGVVVSDYTSVENIVEKCPIEENAMDAGVHCLKAGLDVELPNQYGYGPTLAEAVRKGKIEEAYVNRSVERILKLKFELGLFEKPYGEFQEMDNTENDIQSAVVSRKVMTLTKNNGILPLKDRSKKIAVIGPTGNNLLMLNGAYSYPANEEMFMVIMNSGMVGMEGIKFEEDAFVISEEKTTALPDFTDDVDAKIREQHGGTKTIYEAMKELFPNTVYEKGCHFIKDEHDFEAAERAAQEADIVILTVGGKIGMMSECTAGEGVDNVDITLPGRQSELIRRVHAVNPNVVIVHTDNKPLIDPFFYENIPAILEGWLPGIYGGNAIAETIVGLNNPAGKLPMDIPRHVGQTPVYFYQHTGSRSDNGLRGINPNGYGTMTCASQLPFGHGLSYTEFVYESGTMDVTNAEDGMPVICISIDVTNVGAVDGEEVVQLYGIDKRASIIRPAKELIGFKRVVLKAGETIRAAFSFRIDQLAFINLEGEWIVEKGDFIFFFGKGCNLPVYEVEYHQDETMLIDYTKRDFFADVKLI
ncbi:glycoside hydrolase family 3 N-terminal domain-containing protein [Faecalicatena contorta]|uniref:beta-glucosidase n=1 Tax=Clostridia TaxID=186801 RepID=UPI00067EBAE3